MSKRVNGKKGNRFRRQPSTSDRHRTKARGGYRPVDTDFSADTGSWMNDFIETLRKQFNWT